MSKKGTIKSKCCNARVDISIHGEHLTTKCSKCGKDCLSISCPRRTWKRKPVTQVQQDKREQKARMFSTKELREFHEKEDF